MEKVEVEVELEQGKLMETGTIGISKINPTTKRQITMMYSNRKSKETPQEYNLYDICSQFLYYLPFSYYLLSCYITLADIAIIMANVERRLIITVIGKGGIILTINLLMSRLVSSERILAL